MRRRTWTAWSSLGLVPRVAAVVLGVLFVALVGVFALRWAPQWLATEGLTGTDRAAEIGRARTGVLAALAGLIAVVGAAFTALSYRLNRAGQITERFTRAIDQLGNAALDVRLGGIYALERIARDSSDDHPQIVDVLTAYVRGHARWQTRDRGVATMPGATAAATSDPRIEAIRALERIANGPPVDTAADSARSPSDVHATDDKTQPTSVPTDVQAALSVLGRRDASHDRAGARVDLRGTDLRHADLSEANLQGAHLEANLQGAALVRANLAGAHIVGANLQSADLTGANLQDASLVRANLQSADLFAANLQRAYLYETNLQGADLAKANLQRASLYETSLQDASLYETRLQDAGYDAATAWPEGFAPDEHGARLIAEADAPGSVPPSG